MIEIMLDYLRSLLHSLRTYRKGQYLFHQCDSVDAMFLVENGEALMLRRHRDGSLVVLQRAATGAVLAEASLFSSVYHCDAIANTRIVVRLIPRIKMKELFETNVALASNWASYLADEVRNARLRAEILSLKTVSERLNAWIANAGCHPTKGRWKATAQEIGISAEALYREIASRKAR